MVAYDQTYGIGAAGDLLWGRDLPDDLRHFKELTTGGVVIMGRKTYESIGRALPNRQNIVISHQALHIDGATVVNSLEKAYKAAEPGKEVFIIGGGQIYAQALTTVNHIYATEVHAAFTADIFFPAIDTTQWREVSRANHVADERNKYDFDFVTYERLP